MRAFFRVLVYSDKRQIQHHSNSATGESERNTENRKAIGFVATVSLEETIAGLVNDMAKYKA